MKGNSAKVNQIIFASVCLIVALALAVFTCFAWFTSNLNANNGLSATVSDGNITDLAVSYYALTNKTEGASATTYTVGDKLAADNNGVPINAYGSTGSTITLIEVTYTVKDGTATKLIFTGSGAATFPATLTEVKDSLGDDIYVYRTSLSNAVSLRLAYSVTTVNETTTVTATKTAQTFCDVSKLDSSVTEDQTIDKSDIILRDITKDNYGSVDSSGYYDITVYVIMEYSEENVAALYPSSGASYSTPLSCTKDITLVVKSNDSSDDTDDSSSSASSSSSESSSGESSSSESSSSDSSSNDSSSSDSSSSDSSSSGGDSSGTATTGIDAVVNISDLVTDGTLSATTYSENQTFYSGTDGTSVTFTASSSSTVSIDNNSKSIDGYSFSYRLKLGGAGSTSARSLQVNTVGACTITVYAMSSSSSATRTLALYDSGYSVLDNTQSDDGSDITKYTFTVDAKGTYYIVSTSGGMNIYGILITY